MSGSKRIYDKLTPTLRSAIDIFFTYGVMTNEEVMLVISTDGTVEFNNEEYPRYALAGERYKEIRRLLQNEEKREQELIRNETLRGTRNGKRVLSTSAEASQEKKKQRTANLNTPGPSSPLLVVPTPRDPAPVSCAAAIPPPIGCPPSSAAPFSLQGFARSDSLNVRCTTPKNRTDDVGNKGDMTVENALLGQSATAVNLKKANEGV
jgi:hypothetical protein